MSSGKGIDSLPDELLLEIFSYISTEELAMTVQHVNCHWKEVSQDNSLWEKRTYRPDEKITDGEIVQHLRNMPLLKIFSPQRGLRTKKIIDTICNNCREIEHLEFYESQILELHTLSKIVHAFPDLTVLHVPLNEDENLFEFFTVIGQLKKLVTLEFPKDFVFTVPKLLTILADECSSLQHLDLGFGDFYDEDIRYFLEKKRYQLVSFSVRCYTTAETFKALTECTKLEYLVYKHHDKNIPDAYMHRFSKLSKLKYLSYSCFSLHHTKKLDNIFADSSLPHLCSLEISWSVNLEAETLSKILRNCSGLKEFKLIETDVQGGFESIGICKRLEKLTLQCSELAAENFEYIGAGCHKLRHLFLRSCRKITDKEFEKICIGCPLLEHVEIIDSCHLTDTIIKQLFNCKNLRYLSIIENHNITGRHLCDIPKYLVHLKILNISFCEKFDEEIIAKLCSNMPQFKIFYDKGSFGRTSYFDTGLVDVEF